MSIIDKIIEDYSPEKIILFGSYAYGEPSEDSDIDLLIIKNTDKRPVDRWIEVKRIIRDTTRTVPVSPLVYTEKEIDERKAWKIFLLRKSLMKEWCFMDDTFQTVPPLLHGKRGGQGVSSGKGEGEKSIIPAQT